MNPFFSNEVIRKLIDYSTKTPSLDEYKTGHKFPYNATQILLSENKDILDRIFNQIKFMMIILKVKKMKMMKKII